jgi:four helix bundle protein
MSYFFKDLIVWQEAKAFALAVYEISDSFPKREIYGMTAQIRRAAVSIPSNIAEEQGRLTKGEFMQFLGHARGSLLETITQLEIAADRKYFDRQRLEGVERRAFQLLRLLNPLIESLRNDKARGTSA